MDLLEVLDRETVELPVRLASLLENLTPSMPAAREADAVLSALLAFPETLSTALARVHAKVKRDGSWKREGTLNTLRAATLARFDAALSALILVEREAKRLRAGGVKLERLDEFTSAVTSVAGLVARFRADWPEVTNVIEYHHLLNAHYDTWVGVHAVIDPAKIRAAEEQVARGEVYSAEDIIRELGCSDDFVFAEERRPALSNRDRDLFLDRSYAVRGSGRVYKGSTR